MPGGETDGGAGTIGGPGGDAPGLTAETLLLTRHFTGENLPQVRAQVEDTAAAAGLGGVRLGEFTLAVSEIAANAVEHAAWPRPPRTPPPPPRTGVPHHRRRPRLHPRHPRTPPRPHRHLPRPRPLARPPGHGPPHGHDGPDGGGGGGDTGCAAGVSGGRRPRTSGEVFAVPRVTRASAPPRFGLLTGKLALRGVHTSVKALEDDVTAWISTVLVGR